MLTEGDVAQMVERSLSMREVRGSIPCISSSTYFEFISSTCHVPIFGNEAKVKN